MKITLIYAGVFEGNNVVPPLGIMYIAAVLEKAGHRIQILDVDPFHEEYIGKIRAFGPRLIGVGFLTTAYPRVRKLIPDLKAHFPDAIYCCGGPHATALPREVMEEFDFDFVVIGEGELTMVEACERLDQGLDLEGVRGLQYKKGETIVSNPLRPLIEDLDSLPLPARHLTDYATRYLTYPGVLRGRWLKSTVITASRGCPFSCNYCSVNTIFGRKQRLRSVANVMMELKHLVQTYGIKGLYFIDSSFSINRKWVIELSRALSASGLNLVWGCNSRVDTISEDMLVEMKKAGCYSFDFGVESGSERILRIMNKSITIDQVLKAYALVKKAGMQTSAYFMLGNIGETLEDAEKTFELAKKLNANYTIFYYTTPFPGTKLYDESVKNGWLQNCNDFNESWTIRESDDPVLTIHFTADELRSLRAKYQNYFFARNYLKLSNLKIIGSLLFIAMKNPGVTWRLLKKFFRTRRLDTLAESFLTQYRLKLLSESGRSPA